MSEVARRALEKLLLGAENAVGRGSIGRSVSLRFSEASFPDYLCIATHAEKMACNGALELAQKYGAISILWDTRAGERASVERIAVVDKDLLSEHLGIEPRWDTLRRSEAEFSGLREAHPVLNAVLDCWRKGGQARGTRPGNTADWKDAVAIVDFCRKSEDLEIPVRRLSAHQLDETKRIEKLASIIDAVLQTDLSAPIRDQEEVFAELGLIKYPQTVLMSGAIDVVICGQTISISRPYLGVPPLAIDAFVPRTPLGFVLTIENLQSFHEFVASMPADANAVVLYTGGMPSPSWKCLLQTLLKSIASETPILHWGDIDLGGFRIASHVAQTAMALSRKLSLYGMVAPPLNDARRVSRKELSKVEVARIVRICEEWQWLNEAEKISMYPHAIEQESVLPRESHYSSVAALLHGSAVTVSSSP